MLQKEFRQLYAKISPSSYILFDSYAKKYVYVREAPPITEVVFAAGGAKGIIYPGVVKELLKHNIKRVAGSSVGAITASFFAAGISAEKSKELATTVDLTKLLGSSRIYFYKDGVPLLNFIRHGIWTAITDFLTPAEIDKIKKSVSYLALSPEDKEIIRPLLQHPLPESFPITFKMLEILCKLDSHHFKELSINAIRQDTGKLYYFNAKTTPNLEIALACRASASLPVFLEPAEIEARSLGINQPGKIKFIDGGYVDSIPTEAFDDLTAQQDYRKLVLVFHDKNEGSKIRKDYPQSPLLEADPYYKQQLFIPRFFTKLKADILAKLLCGLKTPKKFTEQKIKALNEVNEKYTTRNIPLNTGIKTQDFKKARKRAEELIAKGEEETRQYFENHEGEAIYESVDKLSDIFLLMPNEEIDFFLEENAPHRTSMKYALIGECYSLDKQRIDQWVEKARLVKNFKEKTAKMLVNITVNPNRLTELFNTIPNDERQSYYNYVSEQLLLHQDSIVKDIINRYSIDKDFKHTLLQKELLRWIEKTKKSSKRSCNKLLLDEAKEIISRTTSCEQFIKILNFIKSNYRREEMVFSFLNKNKLPSPCLEAEQRIARLEAFVAENKRYCWGGS